MTQYFLEAHSPNLPSRRHRLPSGSCYIGIGTGTDTAVAIRVGSHGAVPSLKLRCERRADGVSLRAELPDEALMRFRGTAHRELLVPWSEDVFVGSLRLCFMADSGKDHWWAAAMSLVASVSSLSGGIVYALWWNDPPPVEQGAAPPALTARAACPDTEPTLQVRRGDGETEMARARVDRFPFDAREGTLALNHMARARACYAAATDTRRADQLAGEYEAWRGRLEAESRALVLSIEEAIASERYGDARRLVVSLRGLLHEHTGHPFCTWLRQLDRWLDAQIADRRKGIASSTTKPK